VTGAFTVRNESSFLAVEDFPKETDFNHRKGAASIRVVAHILEASECASADETRYIMNGVCLEKDRIVATDGRRLIVIEDDNLNKGDRPFIIPSATCKLLKRVQKFLPDIITVKEDERIMKIETNKLTFVSKLVEGNFPNWRQVVPKLENKSKVGYWDFESCRDEAHGFVATTAKLHKKNPEDAKFLIALNHNGNIYLLNEMSKKTAAEMAFDNCAMFHGDPDSEGEYPIGVTSCLNPEFAAPVLKNFDGMYITDKLDPVLAVRDGAFSVIMPLRY
jgi:DNA polymerase III sliding clamp (beta) subunit (PCNA family)